jgi:hypothetical protein
MLRVLVKNEGSVMIGQGVLVAIPLVFIIYYYMQIQQTKKDKVKNAAAYRNFNNSGYALFAVGLFIVIYHIIMINIAVGSF